MSPRKGRWRRKWRRSWWRPWAVKRKSMLSCSCWTTQLTLLARRRALWYRHIEENTGATTWMGNWLLNRERCSPEPSKYVTVSVGCLTQLSLPCCFYHWLQPSCFDPETAPNREEEGFEDELYSGLRVLEGIVKTIFLCIGTEMWEFSTVPYCWQMWPQAQPHLKPTWMRYVTSGDWARYIPLPAATETWRRRFLIELLTSQLEREQVRVWHNMSEVSRTKGQDGLRLLNWRLSVCPGGAVTGKAPARVYGVEEDPWWYGVAERGTAVRLVGGGVEGLALEAAASVRAPTSPSNTRVI